TIDNDNRRTKNSKHRRLIHSTPRSRCASTPGQCSVGTGGQNSVGAHKLLDLWRYRQTGPQGEVVEEVVVRGWLNSNHRDNLLALALGHGGVMRIAYATAQADLASGRLVPALLDWELMDPPPLAMYFRPELRRTLRLRVFADFAAAICTELSQMTDAKGQASVDGRPAWHQGNSRRASSWLSHR
ncbi:MAG: hypothetical protein L6Q69_22040, partial [Zoogloea sp.]|nr:hypothetical protein [Zoogloea sp.]